MCSNFTAIRVWLSQWKKNLSSIGSAAVNVYRQSVALFVSTLDRQKKNVLFFFFTVIIDFLAIWLITLFMYYITADAGRM